MTKNKYISMCEALGDPIIESDMPPDIEDFPSYVHISLDIFNCLPDTYSGGMDPIYSGKDIGAMTSLFKIMEVDPKDYIRILKVVQYLDTRARKKAISEAKKRARKK
jgi:hypothetical protein